jgi:hypothetical protein
LGLEETSKRLLTLRYKYFVIGGMMERDIEDISDYEQVKSKLIYLFNRIE